MGKEHCDKGMGKGCEQSNAETPRSYTVQTPQGEMRNRIHLREAAMPAKIVLRAPNREKVKSVLTAPNQSPVVQSMLQKFELSMPKPNCASSAKAKMWKVFLSQLSIALRIVL